VNILFIVTAIFFFVALINDAFFYLSLFAEKDYSVRRLFVHLRETRRGKSIITGRVTLFKWVLIFSYAATIFVTGVDFYFHLAVFFLYTILFINLIRRLYNKELALPKFSKITILAFCFSMLVVILLFVIPPIDVFLWMLVIDKLLLLFVTIFIVFLSIFVDFGRDISLNQAIEKIDLHKRLLTIAVVGTYGRGSTKEFIYHVLSQKFNVLATSATYENVTKIAETINKSLTSKKQIFIAEIDDYNKHDVADICELIQPKIVVVCGINEQKLSIFKTVENILESKMEAVNSLARDGIAIFNGNSALSESLYPKAQIKKFLYYAGNKKRADIAAGDITEGKFSLSFNVTTFGKRYSFSNVKLLGRQNIENLLPAIFIGVYAGIDFSRIRSAIAALRPLRGTMSPAKTQSGAIIIDDTYNANINSVQRALSYMKLYDGKKVLVLEPLVELGKNAKRVHFDLGKEIGKVANFVFLTNDNNLKSIREGIKSSKKSVTVEISTPTKVSKFIEKNCKKDDVVVFEGHETAIFHKAVGAQSVFT